MKLSVCAVPLLLFLGCATASKFSDVPNIFLEDVDIRSKQEFLPFDHAWVKPGFKLADYTKVYFKPVRVDKLPLDKWRLSASLIIADRDDYLREAEELAKYFQQQLAAKMESRKGKHQMEMVEVNGEGTLAVEVALTELQFARPVSQAGALAAPVPGMGVAVSAITEPHVSFAMRVTDSVTGELVATAADRKFPPMRIVDFNKLTVTSSPREICSLWSDTISEIFNGDRLSKIKEKRFSLIPW